MEYPFKDLLPLDEVLEREGYYRDWTHIDADTFHQISDLARFIREKGYGADTREAIAQALERVYHDATMSGNANMEVSMARKHFKDLASRLDASDDKLTSATTQLAEKVTHTELDAQLATLLDGGPAIFMDSLAMLESTYPDGAAGVALVRETDPAKIYVWDGNIWKDFGDYQGLELKNEEVTTDKIARGSVTSATVGHKRLEAFNADFITDTVIGDFSMAIGSYDHRGYVESQVFYTSTHALVVPPNTKIMLKTNNDYRFKLWYVNEDLTPIEPIGEVYSGQSFYSKNNTTRILATTYTAFNVGKDVKILPTDKFYLLSGSQKEKIKSEYLPQDVGIIKDYQTELVDSGFIGSFSLSQIEFDFIKGYLPSAIYYTSDDVLEIESDIRYSIDHSSLVKFRVFGLDSNRKIIPNNFISNLSAKQEFYFANPLTKYVLITTKTGEYENGGTIPYINPSEKVKLIRKDKTNKIKNKYLPDYSQDGFIKTRLFERGVDFGSNFFRIPFGLTTKHGTIIAGGDIRMEHGSDFGDIRIGVARSIDDGKTFSHKQEIIKANYVDKFSRSMDGAIIYDEVTDEIFIFAVELHGIGLWYEDGVGDEPWDLVYVKSNDDGITWSEKTSIKHIISGFQDYDRFLTGVGTGTQMRDGTLVLPVQISKNGAIYSSLAYSTDHGVTWVMAENHLPQFTSESTVVETADGTILMNARGFYSAPKQRLIYKTTDLGTTWTPMLSNDPDNAGHIYQSSGTMGSMIWHTATNGKPYLLFSAPYDTNAQRSNITLFKSTDLGDTWETVSTIYWGNFHPETYLIGYTCLISHNGKLFVMMENNGDFDLWDITSLAPNIMLEAKMLPK